ncbi:MAG TPA: HD domain-containing protein [Anaerolineae bacterium]|nr:HD domain-containing protein [Anaerolineae bacterium]
MITIEFARTLYPADADSAHDFDHVLRVVAMADRIARAEGADRNIVRTAALLHDIGLDGGRAGHETAAAARAKEILLERGYDEVFSEAVAHAIEAHRFRSGPTPQTLEAQVLFDADKLDAIGAIGVARAFAFGAHRGQRLWGTVPDDYIDQLNGVEADPHEHTAVHEFHVKLSKIKDRLFTATGKKIAAERHAFMVEFYAQLDREVKGTA